jgi:hypothetical protein
MKKGLPGDTLRLVDWELSRGGPFRCCTPVWISAASVSNFICLTARLLGRRYSAERRELGEEQVGRLHLVEILRLPQALKPPGTEAP